MELWHNLVVALCFAPASQSKPLIEKQKRVSKVCSAQCSVLSEPLLMRVHHILKHAQGIGATPPVVRACIHNRLSHQKMMQPILHIFDSASFVLRRQLRQICPGLSPKTVQVETQARTCDPRSLAPSPVVPVCIEQSFVKVCQCLARIFAVQMISKNGRNGTQTDPLM